VAVRNPFARPETARVRLVVPAGWDVVPAEREVALEPNGTATVGFRVDAQAPGRIAADLTVGETRFGRQAEAIVE
jgi:hypothetical protein